MTSAPADVGLSIGKQRALQSVSTADEVFAILAIDHIGALAGVVRPDDPSSVTTDQLVEIKAKVVELLGGDASGVLLDPVLALEPIIRRGALPGNVGMLVALEDGDYASLGRSPRLFEGWDVGRAAASGATAIKCSFWYDPFSPSEDAHQFVMDLVAGCDRHGLPLFAEPLVPKTATASVRSVVVETARKIGGLGVDILKLEFPSSHPLPGGESEWRDACAELTEASPRPWTLLSGGEGFETFAKQLAVACENGASGYVAGRAVWNDLVASGVAVDGPEVGEARRRIEVLSEIAASHATPWSRWFNFASTSGGQL